MRIKEILKRGIITAEITSPIHEVSTIMKEKNIGFLPILKNDKIVGVVTDRDIVIGAIANNCSNDQSIEDYINKNIVKIDYNRELKDALDLMKIHKIKRILVVDGEKFIGVLSLSDIIEKDEKGVLNTIKTIWKIDDKDKFKEAEIDDFYL